MKIYYNDTGLNNDYLEIEVYRWDDRGYNTSFYVSNSTGDYLGIVKIAHSDMHTFWEPIYTTSYFNKENIVDENGVLTLNNKFYSIGSETFYENIWKYYEETDVFLIYKSLNDMVYDEKIYNKYKGKNCFIWSLSRNYNKNYIEGPLKRKAYGRKNVKYSLEIDIYNDNKLKFNIDSNAYPPLNTCAIIGPNASGKTKLLIKLCNSILHEDYNMSNEEKIINATYISFSPFDNPEILNEYQSTYSENFTYIGLYADIKKNEYESSKEDTKETSNEKRFKNNDNNLYVLLNKTVIQDLFFIIKNKEVEDINLLNTSIKNLSYDPNIKDLKIYEIIKELQQEENIEEKDVRNKFSKIFSDLSSGYKIVFITIISLIRNFKEQSILIIDEPELFLHPPLVLAYINEVNRIISKKNGFSIIATHSPVVIQQIPIKSVLRINRVNNVVNLFWLNDEVDFESYAGSINEITREIFGLELSETGFYKDLYLVFKNKKNYQDSIDEFNGEVGREGRLLLRRFEKESFNEKN